jgi:hypothetical protein
MIMLSVKSQPIERADNVAAVERESPTYLQYYLSAVLFHCASLTSLEGRLLPPWGKNCE